MRIWVDADACPVVKQTESVASWHKVPVTLICDTNHILSSNYSDVVTIGAGKDAVDFALVNHAKAGDVVISQDYGVTAMALAKGAYAIHHDGWQYTDKNIEILLTKRHHIQKLLLSSHKNYINGSKKRTEQDNENFIECLDRILSEANGTKHFEGENTWKNRKKSKKSAKH